MLSQARPGFVTPIKPAQCNCVGLFIIFIIVIVFTVYILYYLGGQCPSAIAGDANLWHKAPQENPKPSACHYMADAVMEFLTCQGLC